MYKNTKITAKILQKWLSFRNNRFKQYDGKNSKNFKGGEFSHVLFKFKGMKVEIILFNTLFSFYLKNGSFCAFLDSCFDPPYRVF